MKKDNFFKPSVTVDCILFTIRNDKSDNYKKLPEKKLQILLVKRAEEPFKNSWCLPGTFVREAERFEDSVNRVLEEKSFKKRNQSIKYLFRTTIFLGRSTKRS